MLTEILMPCLFANEITLECQRITNALFNTNWLEMSVSDRKLLISFCERLKRPARIKAQQFYDVNLATFMKVLNTSYSFYAILKNTKTKSHLSSN